MKLLLDENLPKRLKEHFLEHEIYTVRDMKLERDEKRCSASTYD